MGTVKNKVKIYNLQKRNISHELARIVHQANPDAKFLVENESLKCGDICYSLGSAIRFWLWHHGVSPKIAFFKLKYLFGFSD